MTTTYTPTQIREAAPALSVLADAVRAAPACAYVPHQRGQEQFHRAPHRIRALFPGNRFGKSRAMATEAAWWIMHRHPYRRIPRGPIQVVWFAPQYRQYEMMRPMVEGECLPAGWAWNGQDSTYRWPDGSMMYIIPQDRDWRYVQGVNPHLVCYDEEPVLAVWREMLVRQFGPADTHYVIAATATMGASWMEREIYLPWVEHHAAQGLDVERAMLVQSHPLIWCWCQGGIADNPTMTGEQVERFEALTFSNPKEREVRLRGGFADWSGDCIFDDAGLAHQRTLTRQGVLGWMRVA